MKILSVAQIKEVDSKTIEYDKISSLQLMEQAASAFFEWFEKHYPDRFKQIFIFCGIGNNGGDGLVTARLLHKSGYRVEVFIVESSEKYSEDCTYNLLKAKAADIAVSIIRKSEETPDFKNSDIVIDAIFGTGINRTVDGISRYVIEAINKSGKTVISIDVPSGLKMDSKTEVAVTATETVTFQIPKLSLFLPQNSIFVGNIHRITIGLNQKAIEESTTSLFYLQKEDLTSILKPLHKFTHKGTQGHGLIICGSLGKIGSVCLASRAALKSGCGLITAFVPKCGTQILQSALQEAMIIEDRNDNLISDIQIDFKPDAIGLGIGLGQSGITREALYRFLQKNNQPLVVDADALNILSENQDWLALLPQKSVLTPHPKELSRLIGDWLEDYDKINKSVLFAKKYNIILLIKGAYSLIIDSENIFVNSSGTPALATAGSGDVLTGMITGFMAQGYGSLEAAKLAVCIHGLTADLTADRIHPRSFIASDIIENIGNAFFEIERRFC